MWVINLANDSVDVEYAGQITIILLRNLIRIADIALNFCLFDSISDLRSDKNSIDGLTKKKK